MFDYFEMRNQAFGPVSDLGFVFTHSKSLGFLINAVVREVGEAVVELVLRQRELVRTEPRETILVQVDSERVQRRDQHVDPQIELEPLYQQRVRNVLAHHKLLVRGVSLSQHLS